MGSDGFVEQRIMSGAAGLEHIQVFSATFT
jgi:hypothetical protein